MAEKAELYRQLADINQEIRRARKDISLCETIEQNRPQMEHDIQVAEAKAKEVERDEYRRRNFCVLQVLVNVMKSVPLWFRVVSLFQPRRLPSC